MAVTLNHACRFAVAALLMIGASETQAKILAQWVQVGPDGTASVRAITDEALCPAVTFDGTSVAMAVRSEPGQKFGNVHDATFDVRGCEVNVPTGANAAMLDGMPLPLPKPDPKRILVFGDTGCRLLGRTAQNCNDPNDWPFAKISALAAATKPDLVIHVGDYHYRESACPVNNKGCAGSPSGYGFDAWYADFFEPAAPLLATAPWVLVRGNHEDCIRAGEGWFRFLDRAPMESTCRDLTGAFVARLGEFGVVVIDGAAAENPKSNADAMVQTLRRQFLDVVGKVPAEAWIASHRPFNAMVSVGDNRPPEVDNSVQEAAFGPVMPAGVRMEVAGHVHFFQAVDFDGARPPTLVVGTGGDALATMAPMSVIGSTINGMQVANSVTRLGFGYMIWEREADQWSGTLFDVNGTALGKCGLDGRWLHCGL
jgi:Calcineurin-like phosphoesterase